MAIEHVDANYSRGAVVKLERKLRNECVEWVHGRAGRAMTSILLLFGNKILLMLQFHVMGVRRHCQCISTKARALTFCVIINTYLSVSFLTLYLFGVVCPHQILALPESFLSFLFNPIPTLERHDGTKTIVAETFKCKDLDVYGNDGYDFMRPLEDSHTFRLQIYVRGIVAAYETGFSRMVRGRRRSHWNGRPARGHNKWRRCLMSRRLSLCLRRKGGVSELTPGSWDVGYIYRDDDLVVSRVAG